MRNTMEKENLMEIAIKNKDVKVLCEYFFGDILTDLQADLVRKIAFKEYNRLSVCAMTRWGKTFCVSRGIALYILFNPNKTIIFMGPQKEQAAILRNYMSELILRCPELLELADFGVTGYERIKKEVSKSRLTFKNGCEYRILSAHGSAEGLMGFGVGGGGGIVVKDEACLINSEANTKIMRMLGDNPKEAILVELFNPWDRDNKAFEHWNDPNFHRVHVGWQDAAKDGRTTKEFIIQQKKEMTPLEFTVLYDSKFPEESEDSVFNLAKIEIARKQDFGFDKELEGIEAKLAKPYKYTEFEIRQVKQEAEKFKKIIACDPADKGRDHTVILWGIKKENKYQLIGSYSEPKSESMAVVGKIMNKIREFIGAKIKGEVYIDRIGIGAGPLSRLKELIQEKDLRNVRIIGCHFGEQAIKKDIFVNKKAENYFRAQALFNEEMMQILNEKELIRHLLVMKWELSSSEKKKIIDPKDYSPDWADALVFFIWKDSKEFAFAI